jgi:hypothetical protein
LKSIEVKGSKTFIIFAVLEVYYVNKKAEEQKGTKGNQKETRETKRNQKESIKTN